MNKLNEDCVVSPFEDVEAWMNIGHGIVVDEDNAVLYNTLVREEFREFVQAQVDEEGEAAEFKEALDLLWVIIGYIKARGWPIGEGWLELAGSNFSKFTVSDDGKLVALKRADGKILKPRSYMAADMQAVLNNNQEI